MDKEDARYQKLEQLHERRKQVVRLHRKGHGVMAIVGMTGVNTDVRGRSDALAASINRKITGLGYAGQYLLPYHQRRLFTAWCCCH